MFTDKQQIESAKYIGELKACRRCGNNVHEYYYESPHVDNNNILCTDCQYELNPPQLHLVIMIEHGLWNATQSRWERKMGLKDFQECGWFVRKVVKDAVPIKRLPKNTGHENIYLEFFGSIKCLRVRSRFYPISLGICRMDDCAIQSIGG